MNKRKKAQMLTKLANMLLKAHPPAEAKTEEKYAEETPLITSRRERQLLAMTNTLRNQLQNSSDSPPLC